MTVARTRSAAVLSVALVLAAGTVPSQERGRRTSGAAGPASLIAGYRRWTRANARPHRVAAPLAAACRNPSAAEIAAEAANPHRDRFVTVFVNETGRDALLRRREPDYPRGTIIVKEKRPDEGDGTPELLTVMLRRERGYDPAGGDWEYQVWDGAGRVRQAAGRLKSCRSCHAQWKETGYVSRAYLGAAARARLR